MAARATHLLKRRPASGIAPLLHRARTHRSSVAALATSSQQRQGEHEPARISAQAMRSCSVAVVGAGAAGLVAARELLREGHAVTVYEQGSTLGGIWQYDEQVEEEDLLGANPRRSRRVHSSMYRDLRTNLPREIMGYSDFPFTPALLGHRSVDSRRFCSHVEVLHYLQAFADYYDLRRHVRYNACVESVVPLPLGEAAQAAPAAAVGAVGHGSIEIAPLRRKWRVRARGGPLAAAAAVERAAAAAAGGEAEQGSFLAEGQEEVREFDAVVVCNGHYSVPKLPDVRGIDAFPGLQLHSHNYRSPEPFAGKVVMVVGASNSGEDISREIAAVARAVIVSARTWKDEPLFTPYGPQGNMYRYPMVSELTAEGLALFQHTEGHQAPTTSPSRSNLSASASFPSPSASGPTPSPSASASTPLASASGSTTATLTSVKVDVVIYATGYSYSFPFLLEQQASASNSQQQPQGQQHQQHQQHQQQLPAASGSGSGGDVSGELRSCEQVGSSIRVDDQRVGPLYEHMWPPHFAPGLSFLGLPWRVVPFPQAEVQAKLVARALSGRVVLPSREAMLQAVHASYRDLQARGVPQRYTHMQSGEQWAYNDALAAMCGPDVPPTADWRIRMYVETSHGRRKQAETFRDGPFSDADQAALADAYRELDALAQQLYDGKPGWNEVPGGRGEGVGQSVGMSGRASVGCSTSTIGSAAPVPVTRSSL